MSPTPTRSLPLWIRASPGPYVLHPGLLHAGSPSGWSSASRPWLCTRHGFGFCLTPHARPRFCVVRLNLRKLCPTHPQLRSPRVPHNKPRPLGSRPSFYTYRLGCQLLHPRRPRECRCPCLDQVGNSRLRSSREPKRPNDSGKGDGHRHPEEAILERAHLGFPLPGIRKIGRRANAPSNPSSG